jgi:hypothetical protein
MRKHMYSVHGVLEKSIRNPPTFGLGVKQAVISELHGNTVQFKTPTTPFDKSLEQLFNLTRLEPFANLVTSLQANLNDKNKIAMLERENAKTRLENWIIPNSEIQGLSGYVCRRCNSFGFVPVRDIGYDMTMQTRHRCDEDRVKSIKMVSIRPSDVWHLYDTAAGIILNGLNRLMPYPKYLLAQDVSKSYLSLERMVGPFSANLLLGIPDRYYMYSVNSNEKIEWLERVLVNLGKKTMVEESEIRDFLRTVQATFAFFEMTRDKGPKRYLIKITT